MAYAAGRRYCDADSHILETWDWVEKHADADILPRLRPLGLRSAGAAAEKAIGRAVDRVKNGGEAVTENVVAGPKGWAAYGAFDTAERTRALDDLGFERQLVFSTFSGSQYFDLPDVRRCTAAFAPTTGPWPPSAAATRASSPSPRSRWTTPRGRWPKSSTPSTSSAAARSGCPPSPPASAPPATPTSTRSGASWRRPRPLHAAHRPGHQGAARRLQQRGKAKVTDWLGGGENLRFKDYMVLSMAPQMFLASLVHDGVFERFPGLRGGVIELGAGWVPEFLRSLDMAHRMFRQVGPVGDRDVHEAVRLHPPRGEVHALRRRGRGPHDP
jgi:hypothetical protein